MGADDRAANTAATNEQVSRRHLLRRAGAAAAAGAAGAALLRTDAADAATGDPVLAGDTTSANAVTELDRTGGGTGLYVTSGTSGQFWIGAVVGDIDDQIGGAGGVVGEASGTTPGVFGISNAGMGVSGTSGTNSGVGGQSTTGPGVGGSSVSGAGVAGISTSGAGVEGVSTSGDGFFGSGVRGADLIGTAAQVRLRPGSMSTHPKSGKRGDFYVDNTGRLWFCKTTSKTAATWKQLA